MDHNNLTRTGNLLIVEDNPANLVLLGEEFKNDYNIFIATSGEEALEQVESSPPDLILLDIVLPGIDGFEVCRRLKEIPGTSTIPIIFITAKNSEVDEIEGLALGAVDYITKPFKLPVVRARLKTHFDLKVKTDLLESMSNRDGLTGIYNRRHLDTTLKAEWARARRNRSPLSVAMVDLDYFKKYNDNYGHLAGDECLRKVADSLTRSFKRASDFVARYGGEEFCVVMPETASENAYQIVLVAVNAIKALQLKHDYSAVGTYLTVSAGVATTVPNQNNNWPDLLKLADDALYEAKRAGRDRVGIRAI